MLTATEKIEDYKEVTETEKTALEASDAAWERPPQSFIDEWNRALMYDAGGCLLLDDVQFGKYNEETGFFECNRIKDIPYFEALEIKHASQANDHVATGQTKRYAYAGWCSCRTFWPLRTLSSGYNPGNDFYATFFRCNELEALSCKDQSFNGGRLGLGSAWLSMGNVNFIGGLQKFKHLYNAVGFSVKSADFSNMPSLETLFFSSLSDGFVANIKDSPNWSLQSIKTTINSNRTYKRNWQFIVHADVFDKLNDPDNVEWYKAMTDGLENNITFTTA